MAKKDDEISVEKTSAVGSTKERKNVEEETTLGKISTMIVILLSILICLGAFILAIKFDVGNFGSQVLTPILHDVPVVNKILPEDGSNTSAHKGEYNFKNMDEAIARIKELELLLEMQSSTSGVDSNYIMELEAEIARLKYFENQQTEFARQKKEFDEEVVYTDAAPDITEYQKFYEQMDPDNAAEIYRQVVEQVQYDAKVKEEAQRYANMEADAAAKVLDVMAAADLDLVCGILSNMKAEQSAAIMQELDSNVAAKITKRMLSKE